MEITIRNWERKDVKHLVRYANNRKIWDNLADAFPSPYTEEDALVFLTKVANDHPRKIMAIDCC